jgi:hypothetical protein
MSPSWLERHRDRRSRPGLVLRSLPPCVSLDGSPLPVLDLSASRRCDGPPRLPQTSNRGKGPAIRTKTATPTKAATRISPHCIKTIRSGGGISARISMTTSPSPNRAISGPKSTSTTVAPARATFARRQGFARRVGRREFSAHLYLAACRFPPPEEIGRSYDSSHSCYRDQAIVDSTRPLAAKGSRDHGC